MLFQTILDPMEVFGQESKIKYCYKKVDKCILEGVEYKNEGLCVSRIISTDLKDYLNPTWNPGAIYREKQE